VVYYNAKTRANLPCRNISNIIEIPETHPFYAIHCIRCSESKEVAMEHTYQGLICYFENGKLYQGFLRQIWSYSAVETATVCEGGINWTFFVGITPDELFKVVNASYAEIDEFKPQYDEETDLWKIQVHYDGRTR